MPEKSPVGYKKPPVETQFQKGRSGNPKGRPKDRRNIATIFNRVGNEKIQVIEQGRRRGMTRKEAAIRRLTADALSGKNRALNDFLRFCTLMDAVEDGSPAIADLKERDKQVMSSFLTRMKRNSEPATATEDRNERS